MLGNILTSECSPPNQTLANNVQTLQHSKIRAYLSFGIIEQSFRMCTLPCTPINIKNRSNGLQSKIWNKVTHHARKFECHSRNKNHDRSNILISLWLNEYNLLNMNLSNEFLNELNDKRLMAKTINKMNQNRTNKI